MIRIPIKTVNPLNRREHFMARAKRVAAERDAVSWALVAANFRMELPALVTLTRVAPRALDRHDGLPASMKAVADMICKRAGIDDKTDLIDWRYRQRKGGPKEYAVEIEVQQA
jgi:hypothetical protein